MTERRQQPPYPLRMPDSLRDQLAEAAKTNGRSMNAEIVERLKDSLGPSETQQQLSLAAVLAKLQLELAERHYFDHVELVQRSALVREVQDFLHAVDRADLLEKLEDLDGFDALEQLAKEDVYASGYLEQIAGEKAQEIEAAKAKMDEALGNLGRRVVLDVVASENKGRPPKKPKQTKLVD
ncbi:Arc family DNA-binding protein [Achromobacter xylosoxidans]|uniref:Arc family DNA-binding protein n=1 Tax=Alcaligenes xylosoxydans xylosoxydans TaxID=85698 RepID=UPI001F13CA2F|nr:Arc family DNA-binding protein [Achromobacter xylosoxidans]